MRIAVSCHPTQGGSGVVATELAHALAGRGHEVHLVACDKPYRYQEDSGVRFHRVNVPDYPLFKYPPHDLCLANKLAGLARDERVDIIHAHYAVPHAVTALLAKQIVQPHPLRIVTTLHGTDITLVGSHSDFFDLIRHAILGSDAVTAVSAWLAAETKARFDLDFAPHVIPNFVDTGRFHAKGRVDYPGEEGELVLAHASNLRPVKRIGHTLRVFQGVQKALPSRLIVLGEGPEKGLAIETAAEMGLSDRVHFHGDTRDMPLKLRSAHLYLLLSEYESFGLSALEAMACGTPAVVSDAGGLPEVVTHERDGLLCPPGKPHATARAIVDFVKDPERWARASEAAAHAAATRFTVEQVVPLYENLYERALRNEGATR